MNLWSLVGGDCLEVMAEMEPESVDAIVTDPPYGIGFMGKQWDSLPPGDELAAAMLRVCKPGAHLLAFGGTRTFHRLTCAIEDAGFEIRDCIMWVYGTGFPKSRNVGNGWGTALKPAWSPIIVARKPLIGTVAANVLEHGTGGINVDACRVGTDTIGTHGGTGDKYAHLKGGASPAVGENREHSGRWPANLIHDGSDDVLERFPQTASGKPSGKRNVAGFSTAYEHGTDLTGYGDEGSAARFFYCAKADQDERGDGNTHPTIKPIALMAYLCRLVTPPGGVVLDPFAGSGSTLIAATHEGFRSIGIERDPAYVEIARRRLEADAPLFAFASEA